MAVLIKITESGALPWVPKRYQRRALKEAYRAQAMYWHQRLRPKHFTKAGAREYGYTPRSLKHTRRKLQVKGHTRPLVWTGDSERLSRGVRITSTSKGARIFITAPNLNRPTRSGRLDMRAEMTAISDRDAGELTERLTKSYFHRARRIRWKRTRGISR